MEQIMTAKNTLQDFYRSPKLYVGLPSGGAFYDEDVIDWPENNELPVLAMTPKDDLIVRNPDALLNGDAVIRLIRSCVPSIKKPEQIIAPDMELLLVAIRAASESDKAVKIEHKCTECEHEMAFEIDLGLAVQDFQAIDDLTEFELKNGLTVGVKPANYLYSINTAKQMIEQANLLGKIASEVSDSEEERIQDIGKAFDKMANFNYSILVNSVNYIKIPDVDEVVDDKKQILEFLDNVDAKIGTEISDVVSSINNGGINKIHSANCEKCEAPFEVPIDFDPVSFFLTS
tara:strand:+ start:682 stop:1545 length:864 start_codon:yes stop_codon:yes gene_type:complete